MRQKSLKDIKTISKVISIQVAPAKKECAKSIANQIKQIILVQAAIGINRTHLLKYTRCVQLYFYIYGAIFTSLILYTMIGLDALTASYTVIRYTNYAEYFILVLISVIAKRSSMYKIFEDVSHFDEAMNIQSDINITHPPYRGWLWISFSITYCILDYFIMKVYVDVNGLYALAYVAFITHDCEVLYYCSILRSLFMRVRILKAHVTKAFPSKIKGRKRKLNVVEALSNNIQLDVTSLHRNYELLHKCAEQLNYVMSLPMIVMLFCSGLSSTMLLKNLFKVLQSADTDSLARRATIFCSIIRCFKYTILVIIPCYYSSVTTTHVSQIRTMLHDAMNCVTIDKIERRRVKAFFQLTRENEFAYALWGVIRLNMSLPLSYLSLCTTYLVIIIQFSKFID